MLNGILPIGSVVILKESEKKVMIVGVGQVGSGDNHIWDYAGVLFPEGYVDADTLFLFDNEQIAQVYFLGYQDIEQQNFKTMVEESLELLRQQLPQ